jgi:8-oxo-dGTP diphosphatase
MIKFISEKEFQICKRSFPLCCIDVIILNSKSEFLLVKRSIAPYKNKWCLPGGIVHFGEKLENSIERIVKKELGIHIKLIKEIGFFEKVYPSRHDISHCYLATTKDTELKLDFQAFDAKFFSKIPSSIGSFYIPMLKKARLV